MIHLAAELRPSEAKDKVYKNYLYSTSSEFEHCIFDQRSFLCKMKRLYCLQEASYNPLKSLFIFQIGVEQLMLFLSDPKCLRLSIKKYKRKTKALSYGR